MLSFIRCLLGLSYFLQPADELCSITATSRAAFTKWLSNYGVVYGLRMQTKLNINLSKATVPISSVVIELLSAPDDGPGSI